MTLKYEKPVRPDPDNQYSKIVFYPDKIRLDKHSYDTTIAYETLLYLRDDNALKPASENKSSTKLNLLKLEKNTRATFADVLTKIYTELSQRRKEENNIKVWRKDVNNEVLNKEPVVDKSVYDIAIEKIDSLKDDQETNSKANESNADADCKVDFLARYLVDFPVGKPLDCLQAEFVAKKCKNDFRKRLLDRAQIIQKRLEEEQENLKKKRSQMQRRGGSSEQGDERQFEQYQSNAMFRIQILEQRLARHEMQAIKKFVDLEKQLAEDPRLSAMWQKI